MLGLHYHNAIIIAVTFGLLFFHVSSDLYCSDNYCEATTGAFINSTHEGSVLLGYVIDSFPSHSLFDCALQCLQIPSKCKSLNFKETKNSMKTCELSNTVKDNVQTEKFVKDETSTYAELLVNHEVYCDGPWILVARFSNADEPNWMKPEATWWYDIQEAYGNKISPSHNQDMISEAFWLHAGSEFRITRSDDPIHTALLTTTGNCLGGKTFREKMSGYGVFRYSETWAINECLGQCSVVYGGKYTSVDGFNQSSCDGDIQMRDQIGMWCDYGSGDGSVLMIGGGGSGCSRADHGIGITEENQASFVDGDLPDFKFDFGGAALKPSTEAYALNLWVRY